MMTPRLAARTRTWLWLLGVLLSTTAMFLGFSSGNEAARLLGGEPGMWARTGKGFVWGGVIAVLQWPMVRAAGVLPIRFVAASAVGLAAGYPLGQSLQGLTVLQGGLSWVWGYGLALATFGLSLGLPQWWILRGHMRRAGLWILFSVVGWILLGVYWINARAGDGLDSLAYGIVTGLGLVWLGHPTRDDTEVAGP